MRLRAISIMAMMSIATASYAQLPAPQSPKTSEGVHIDELSMSQEARGKLQKRLEKAVCTMTAHQPGQHSLASSGVNLDGAAVAVHAQEIRDVLPKDRVVAVQSAPPAKHNPHSFFGRGLDRATSPFASHRAQPQEAYESTRQYWLTAAGWLTGSTRFEIIANGRPVEALLEYRDDAQNLAVLSTAHVPGIEPVDIVSPDAPQPAVIYLLLNPNSIYESLTQHDFQIDEEHLYGTSGHTARNGYPMFTADGRLAGLSVGAMPGLTRTQVVHALLIDRTLHPDKYSRTTTESVDIVDYSP